MSSMATLFHNQIFIFILIFLVSMGTFGIKITYVKELPKYNRSEHIGYQKGGYLKYIISPTDSVLHKDVHLHLETLLGRVNYGLKIFIYPTPSFAAHFNIDHCLGNNDFERKLSLFLKRFSVPHSQAEKANLFFIDHDFSCINKAWLIHHNNSGSVPDMYRSYMLPVLNNVIRNYPYFNRSHGVDHIFSFGFPSELLTLGLLKELLQTLNRTRIITNIGSTGHRLTTHRNRYMKVQPADIFIPPYYDWEYESPLKLFDGSRAFDTYYQEVNSSHYPIPFPLLKSRPGDSSFGYYSTGIEHIRKRSPVQAYFTICPEHNLHVYETISKNSIPVFISYENVIKPFQRFLNWDLFTLSFAAVMTESQRFQVLETLHINASEHRQKLKLKNSLTETAMNQSSHIHSDDIVGTMLKHTVDASSWLQWHLNSTKNIWSLLSLELWCTIKMLEIEEIMKSGANRKLERSLEDDRIISICNRTRIG